MTNYNTINEKTRIICLPGLGGRSNVFKKYNIFLEDFDLVLLDLIKFSETENKAAGILCDNWPTFFLTSCYGGQLAIRLSKKFPNVAGIIIVEPFFGEFLWWRKPAEILTRSIRGIILFLGRLGLKRKKMPEIDYEKVETWPVFLQPIFDIAHQSVVDYAEKIIDILSWKLPEKIVTPTLLIFSPKGFTRDPKKRELYSERFMSCHVAEINEKSHNIITLATPEISKIIIPWIDELKNL